MFTCKEITFVLTSRYFVFLNICLMLRAVRFPMIFEALKYKQITGQLSKKKLKKKNPLPPANYGTSANHATEKESKLCSIEIEIFFRFCTMKFRWKMLAVSGNFTIL